MEYLPTIVVVAVLMVILPITAIAYPTFGTPSENDCMVIIDTSTQQEMQGRYDGNGWAVSFTISLNQDKIDSITTFRNVSDENSKAVEARLSFPNTPERQIPGMTKHVVDAAFQVAQESDCVIPDNIHVFYQEFADALYKCTMNMEPSQFHFSVMYHGTILASANRLCAGAESVCTPSPKYEIGTGLFICSEDLEELFPNKAREGQERMLSIKNHASQIRPREKRWNPSCPDYYGLEGSDWCCCGNYDGCCSYAHVVCCVHDAACTCCSHWLCGWQCQPDFWC